MKPENEPSVPTESRRPNRLCSNCGVELFANYQEAGWNHCTREMKPFGNGCKFDGLFACAGKCQCPANTEMLGEFAASSSLLPVGRQPQMDDVMRYLESENFGDIATDHKDGGEFCISDAILSFVRFWEKQASLPVGESTPDLHSIICQAVELLNQGDTLKAHTLLRETLAEYVG